jgi:hypothetical protein
MLCGFDVKYCRAKERDGRTTSTVRRDTSTTKTPYGFRMPLRKVDNGTGYESGGYEPEGFYESMFGLSLVKTGKSSDRERAEDAEKRTDQFHTLVFAFLKTLLPTSGGLSSFDESPPGALGSVLVNSKVLNKAAELLRNDSLDDITKRGELYTELMGFLRVVGTHAALKNKAMYAERVIWPDGVNLLTLSFQGPGENRSQVGSSLAAGLKNLNIQSEVMLKGASGAKQEFADRQGSDMLKLCRMISDLSNHLRIKMDDAKQGLTTHGIIEIPDEEIWSTHAAAQKVQSITQGGLGRMKRLITEVTTMKTGLAEGIFVKHGMSRLDVMK